MGNPLINGKKLTALDPIATIQDTDLRYTTQGGESFKATAKQIKDYNIAGLQSGYQGVLLIADTPTEDGYYSAGESGVYVNAGSVVTDLNNGVNYINVSAVQTVFSVTVVPLNSPVGEVAEGDVDAVEGGKIFDFSSKFKPVFFNNNFLNTLIKEVYVEGTLSDPIYLRSFFESGTPGVWEIKIAYWDGATITSIIDETKISDISNYIQLSNASNDLVIHLVIDWSNISNLPLIDEEAYSDDLLISDRSIILENSPTIKNELKVKGLLDSLSFNYGYYILSGSTLGSLVNTTTHKNTIINAEYGDTFIIQSNGGNAPRLWGFVDSSDNILEVADASIDSLGSPLLIIAPPQTDRLVAHCTNWHTVYDNGNIYIQKVSSNYGLEFVNAKTIDTRFSNNLLNSIIKEFYIVGTTIEDKDYYLRNFEYNVARSKWKITVASVDGGGNFEAALFNVYFDVDSDYVHTVENSVSFYAVIDWDKVVTLDLAINNEKNLLNKRCYVLEYNATVSGIIKSKKDQFNYKEIGFDNKNAIWSWWNYPQVISHNVRRNSVYFSGVDNYGKRKVFQYDVDENTYKSNAFGIALAFDGDNPADDHNAVSITILDDGRVATMFAGGHEMDENMYVKISKKPEDIQEWDDAIQIPNSGLTTYAQIFRIANGDYWCFFRSGAYSWFLTKSSDFINWSVPTEFIRNSTVIPTEKQRSYIKLADTTDADSIRIVAYGHPDGIDNNIYAGILNTLTGEVYDDASVSIGNINTSYVDIADLTQVVNQSDVTYDKIRLFDVVKAPTTELYISYARYIDDANAEYFIYYDGVVKSTVESSKVITGSYYGGQAFVDKDTLIISRYDSGNDYVEKLTYNGSNFVLDTLILTKDTGATNELRAARPIVDINGNAFLVHDGFYNKDNDDGGLNVWADHNCDAKLFEL